MDVPAGPSLRLAARRAAFRYALRAGEAAVVARAASRLLVALPGLDSATGNRVRDARMRLGHGLRLARQRRAVGAIPLPTLPARSVELSRSNAETNRRWMLLVALGVIAILLLQLVPAPGTPGEGGGGSVAAAPQVDSTTDTGRETSSNHRSVFDSRS